MNIPIPSDDDGLTGRECPSPECEGYFKIRFGTGLKGADLPCHCPYCGIIDSHQKFWTKEQIKYAQSVVINKFTGALLKDLKAMEFNHRPSGGFGIGMSLRVEGRTHPIRHYREKQLETTVMCDQCTLQYAIYGVFAFCPDCGTHNSRQILDKNLELAEKELVLAATVEGDFSAHLVADALENAVSAFDGFGRETAQVHADYAATPAKAKTLSFQNLTTVRDRLNELFGVDLSVAVAPEEWDFICRCFQKRHLLAHKMGIVDKAYMKATSDPQAVVGRKVSIPTEEVWQLLSLLRKLGAYFVEQLPK